MYLQQKSIKPFYTFCASETTCFMVHTQFICKNYKNLHITLYDISKSIAITILLYYSCKTAFREKNCTLCSAAQRFLLFSHNVVLYVSFSVHFNLKNNVHVCILLT